MPLLGFRVVGWRRLELAALISRDDPSLDLATFLLQEIRDGLVEPRVRDEVRASVSAGSRKRETRVGFARLGSSRMCALLLHRYADGMTSMQRLGSRRRNW